MRRRKTVRRRRPRRRARTLRQRRRQGGGGPLRKVYLDTYKNFLQTAIILGWKCEQSVFPLLVTNTDEQASGICAHAHVAQQLSSLGHPDNTRVKFTIGEITVIWYAFVYSVKDAQFYGQVCLECESDEPLCSVEALTLDEFIILTALAYTSNPQAYLCKNNTGAVANASEALRAIKDADVENRLESMTKTIMPGQGLHRKCHYENYTHLTVRPWVRFWALYLAGNTGQSETLKS